jgi:hypothetical protein
MSTHQSWSTSEERAFTDNLLSMRFNLFVVLFSLVMAGSLNVKTQTQLLLILGIGSGICALVAAVLGRLQEKLDIILADLFADPSHPATIANNKAKPRGSRRRLIGIWIRVFAALFCSLVLSWRSSDISPCLSRGCERTPGDGEFVNHPRSAEYARCRGHSLGHSRSCPLLWLHGQFA